MRYRILLLVCIAGLILLAGRVSAHAQDNWDNYQPGTLKELLKRHGGLTESAETRNARLHLLFTDSFPTRVKVNYTGEKRAIPAKRKEFIDAWARSRALKQEIVDLFQEELLFKEDSTEYWLPVQKQVIPYFAEELKKGDTVELFLIVTGAKIESGVADWVFLVNEFKK